jgi:hypothetical protein
MNWKNILKNDLKNEIDTWAKSQNNPSGPLTIIFRQNKQGPHERTSNVYFVNNEQQFNELKQLYSQTNTVKEKGNNAFFVMS